jgi:hypothetical protein
MDTKKTGNIIVDALIKMGQPLTVENYVALNWFGDKTVADLEGEELVEVLDLVEEGLLSNVTPGTESVQ